ncbi:MAG: DUF4129 domain-containing protein [Pseudonocardia sp.]|nr:DUF4129 domain-containing protein [Pseudonocardia sp.]
MTQRREGGPATGAATVRVGGLAALLVLAVVLARARASGLTPPMPTPSGEFVKSVIRILAAALLTSGVVLLLRFRPSERPRLKVTGSAAGKKAVLTTRNRRLLIIAALIGLLAGLGMQLLRDTVDPPMRQAAPRRPPLSSVDSSGAAFDRPPVRETPADPGIGDQLLMIATLVTLAVLVFVLVRRGELVSSSVGVEDELDSDAESSQVARVIEAGRAAVQDQAIADSRQAVVACFAAMEDALASRGEAVAPRDADTPFEMLQRGIDGCSLPRRPADTLLSLFREARFSTHPMTERDRTEAGGALTELLTALGSRDTARARVRKDSR